MIVIAGPTASGKSHLALALAHLCGAQIINADSMQMYAALQILTARPNENDEAKAPHLLYGTLSTEIRCSAGRWRQMALSAIAEGERAGQTSIIVGGSGLYIEALLKGIAPIPEVPEEIREEACTLLNEIGPQGLYDRLGRVDPELASRLAPGDSQRISRGWEVWLATGRPLSSWQREKASEPGTAATSVLLDPPRDKLREGIARRFDSMLAAGALEEARTFISLTLPPRAPIAKAHGVRPLKSHLEDEISLNEATRLSVNETRAYARRQATWFRGRFAADITLDSGPGELARDAKTIAERIAEMAGLRK